MLRNLAIFLCLAEYCLLANAGKVKSTETENVVTLENGYSKVSFSKRFGHIDSLSADFSGSGSYSENILSDSFGLDVRRVKGNCLQKIKPIPTVEWIEKSDRLHKVKISNVYDCEFSPVVSETWTISLAENMRSVEVAVSGSVLQDTEVESITHSLYLSALSAYGLFERGVAQMMGGTNTCLGSTLPMERSYFLGGGSALDLVRHSSDGTSERPVVLLSAGSGFNSGLQSVVYGTYPNEQRRLNTAWNALCWSNATATAVKAGDVYSVSYSLIPNGADFPVYLLNDVEASQSSLPTVDIQSYLTGIYASPVGCLQSYYDGQTGIIAPTVAHPDIGYSPDSNFFDPDNFLSLSAMLASNDPYLQDQVRQVLERTAETMCGIGSDTIEAYCNVSRQRLHHTPLQLSQFQPSVLRTNDHSSSSSNTTHRVSAQDLANSRTGQLMHHFVSLVPTYESIAGSEQLGPNIFWTLTSLKYIATTQDNEWAVQMFDYIYLSAKFLLTFFDPAVDLIYAPGPLWIDVIVRENYTSDSGAMMVPVLLSLADYFDFVSTLQVEGRLAVRIEPTFTAELRDVSARLSTAINKYLWSTEGDHYLTQLNPDGSSRDFIDYDSNLLTVAYGIAPSDRQTALLARVDGGAHTHIRATWCSEVPYTGDACDCYIVGGTVCGDSVVTLARIGWVDAMARKVIGDQATFDDVLLKPLQDDLIADTWLYERYDENGTQIRTSYYFEYPSLVTMLLHDIRYGIAPGLATFDLDPFPPRAFTYALGNVRIVYGAEYVSLSLPGGTAAAAKRVTVHHLTPLSTYVIGNSCRRTFAVVTAVTDAAGLLAFTESFGDGCSVTATRQ